MTFAAARRSAAVLVPAVLVPAVLVPAVLVPAVVGTVLVATVLVPEISRADNTSEPVIMRVTLVDGTVHDGELNLKKTYLEVRTPRKRKVRYGEIASLSDVPPLDEAALTKRRSLFEARQGRTAADDPQDWIRLAKYAERQELAAEARQAWEKVLELDPDDAVARRALGFLEVDGEWQSAADVLGQERLDTPRSDLDARVSLAKKALGLNLDQLSFDVLHDVLRRDNFHTKALEAMRPLAARYRTQLRMLFPVRGRWRASEDRTRHHQKKSYAVFALDLTKVDSDGRHYENRGRQLTDHFTYGAPFYAVAPGRVIEVRDGMPDNPIGQIGDAQEKHNGVSIDHGNGEISWYVHAKDGSIVVKEGDKVEAGQLLGEIGNSGGSAVPHLHFTLVAHHRLSVPWACENFTILAPDGTPLKVTWGCPREGWTIVNHAETLEPRPGDASPADEGDDEAGTEDGAR